MDAALLLLGGWSDLLLLLILLLVLLSVPVLLLGAAESGENRPEALKPAQGAAMGACCWVLLPGCSLDAAAA